jgi:hypothetical protein
MRAVFIFSMLAKNRRGNSKNFGQTVWGSQTSPRSPAAPGLKFTVYKTGKMSIIKVVGSADADLPQFTS